MPIERSKFNDRLLIIPNSAYFLGSIQSEENLFKIKSSFDCGAVATITLTKFGAFCFTFKDSGDLASIEVLEHRAQGEIPEEVLKNEDDIHDLQEKRMLFVNFIAAAFFGRISTQSHSSLRGALYSGQDRITGFAISQDAVILQPTALIQEIIRTKLEALKRAIFLSEGM